MSTIHLQLRAVAVSAAVAAVLALLVPSVSRAVTLTGTVRNEAGTGLGNVDLDFIDLCSGDNIFLAGDKTAGDGTFSIVVPAGTYDVHFTPPAGSLVVAGDLQDVVVALNAPLGIVTLPAGRLVSGTLRTPALTPAAGVDLKFVDTATQHRRYLGKDLTGATGAWSVRAPPGTYDVDFRPAATSAFADAERRGLVVGVADVSGLADTLRSGFAISGTVRDKRNNKIKNVDVDAYDACTGERVPTAHDNTDVNGNYAIVLPPGTYSFNYDPPACMSLEAARTPATLVDRSRGLGTEQLKDAVAVSGTVLDHSGLPLPGVKVKFFDATAAGTPRQGVTRDRTDGAGHFAIDVPPGTYHLHFEPPAGVLEQVGSVAGVVVGGATSVGTVQLASGFAVSGHVSGPGGGAVLNVNINAVDSQTRAALRLAHDETDAAGNFTVVMAPGTYDLQYDSPGCTALAPASEQRIVVAGNTTLPVLTLVTGARVQGSVLNDTSLAVANVDLDFYPVGSADKIYTPNDKTAADGTYDLLVPPGAYDVKFVPSSLSRLRPAEQPGTLLDVSRVLPTTLLPSGWLVSGTVRDSASLFALPGVTVEFWPPAGAAPAWTPHHLTSLLGAYDVAVDAGTWDLRFVPAPGAPYAPVWLRGIVVAADTPLPDLRMQAQPLSVPGAAAAAGLSISAWPNPARGAVRFAIAATLGAVELGVWDLAGRRVAVLYRGRAQSGRVVTWEGTRDGGSRVAPGVYLVRLARPGGSTLTRRITWLN